MLSADQAEESFPWKPTEQRWREVKQISGGHFGAEFVLLDKFLAIFRWMTRLYRVAYSG
jgi:hypothetical protein